MKKFEFGNYDPTVEADVFKPDKGYVESDGETSTRKQFSYPLKELKDFINDTVSLNVEDDPIQLRLNEQNVLQYRDGEAWLDTASSGHIIEVEIDEDIVTTDEDGNETVVSEKGTQILPQRTKLTFHNVEAYDSGESTHVVAFKGDTGERGPMGPQGPQGIKGDRGEKGEIGLTGPQGEQGIQGPRGDQGPSGPAGSTGPQGPQGIQGIRGEKGEKGDSGNDFRVSGRFNTKAELTTLYPEGTSHPERVGVSYFIGQVGQNNPIFLWNDHTYEWET